MPRLADQYGWLRQIQLAFVVQFCSQFGLLYATNIKFAYVAEFLLGAAFPAKNIIQYNYCQEILSDEWRQTMVNTIGVAENLIILLIPAYYQFVSIDYFYL